MSKSESISSGFFNHFVMNPNSQAEEDEKTGVGQNEA